MNNKLFLWFGVFLLLTLFSVNLVSAWGVLPAKQLADYTNQEQNLKVTIRNNDFDEGFFKVSFAGDLSEYIDYGDSELVYLSPETSETDVFFKLKLDSGLTPGKNVVKVMLQQVPAHASDQMVSSVLTLVAEVVVNVPYEGNYISTQLDVGQVGSSESVPFTVSLLNKGEEAVGVWADITIKGPTNLEIASWNTEKKMLGYLASDKIETFWSGEKQPGVYFAEIIVHYGDKTQSLRKEFVVGDEEVVAQSIKADQFVLGEINKLSLVSQNKWNTPLEDVFAEIYVLTKAGQTIQSFKSNPENFGPYETKELTAFWDTTNLVVGEYILQAMIQTSGHTTQEQFPVVVAIDKLNFDLSGKVAGGSTSTTDSSGSLTSLLIILLIVVVVTNVVIIMYFKRMKKT